MLKPTLIPNVPRDTKRVTRTILPSGNTITRLRDEFGSIYVDTDFAALFSHTGQPALAPWRLALITIFQFLENLSDRQAVHAVLTRIDWKYALSLKLTDASFDHTVLSEFRTRLVKGDQQQLLLDKMLEAFNAKGLLKTRGRQRTDSTHILSSVRVMTRLEHVTETLRAALNALSTHHPEWTRQIAPTEWFERYGKRAEEYHLPRGKQAREDFIARVGDDGYALLEWLEASAAPTGAAQLPAVDALRRMWTLEYIRENGRTRWREGNEVGAARERFNSPYDVEAHHGMKGARGWDGYKVHFTETCESETPNLITNVLTTRATMTDVECTQDIQAALTIKGFTPKDHLVDSGYISARLLVSSRDGGTNLIGPPRPAQGWQAHTEGAFDLTKFKVNFEQKQVTCPRGKKSISWKEKLERHQISVRFKPADCLHCKSRVLCLRTAGVSRTLTFQPEEEFKILRAQRRLSKSPKWHEVFNARAGIEGSFSQGVRGLGLRRSRYRGEARTGLHCVGVAAAMNVGRVGAWLAGDARAVTRVSRFAALQVMA